MRKSCSQTELNKVNRRNLIMVKTETMAAADETVF